MKKERVLLQLRIEGGDAQALRQTLSEVIPTINAGIRKRGLSRVLESLVNDLDTEVDMRVTDLLSSMTGIPAGLIKNESKLGFHLGIGPARIRTLAGPLTLIAQKFKSSAQVTLREAEKLVTVQDCIDIIKSKVA